MKNRRLVLFVASFVLFAQSFFVFMAPSVYAASSPNLGQAASFAILSNSYTNTVAGTTITGDLGYTTGPATAPTVNGTTHAADGTYNTAGTDQGTALVNINNQACTHTFPAGAVNLATDTSHGTIGIYEPGVYCTTSASAASIGSGGITLNGTGTYIFRIDGALTTAANSVVTLANGASSCNVFWAPTGGTTLGANSRFVGTDIDAAGITIGSTVNWSGRALAFGGTVSTNVDTISTACVTTAETGSTGASNTNSTSSTSTGTPYYSCPTIDPGITAPMIIDSKRIDADSVFFSWAPYTGTDKFNVQYGTTKENLVYNVDVTGFSTTLNDLPVNQPIWVRIAARNYCMIGGYDEPTLVGGPGLPKTGLAPKDNSNLSIILGVFVSISLLFFVSVLRKD